MKPRQAVAVLVSAVILGAGAGALGHALVPAESASDGGTRHGPATTTAPPPPLTPMSVDDLLATADVVAAGFAVDPQQVTRGEGDEQYALTLCMRRRLGSVVGGNVFSGDWYDEDGELVSESISVAVNEPQAEAAARRLVGWHRNCSGVQVTVGARTALVDGWTQTFRASGPGGPQAIEVIRVGGRVGLVQVSPPSSAEVGDLFDRAVRRLR